MPTCSSEVLEIQTKEGPEFVDITDKVIEFVKKGNINDGMVVVFSRHTTAAIRISANKPLVLKDMMKFLEALAPKDRYYRHNDFSIRTEHMHEDEVPNAHSHCQSLGLGASETIPVVNEQLQIGKRQKVFLIELDHARKREVVFQGINK